MPTVDIESDPLFQLLTDALRAGPGSAQWDEAVSKVRDAGGQGDDYAMLLDAREHLESGKEYKSVRPGAGFTRKVMGEIEKDDAPGKRTTGLPTATIVAGLSIFAVFSVIALIVFLVVREPSTVDTKRNDARPLANAIFTQTTAVAKFDASPTPDGWKTIGQLPVKNEGGQLRPVLPAGADVPSVGGGIVLATPVPAATALAIEADVVLPEGDSSWLTQVFVGDQPQFDPQSSASSDEVAWDAGGYAGEVIRVGGETVLAPKQMPLMPAGQRGRNVAIRVNAKSVAVFIDHKQVWIGENNLSEDKPRYAGVRFIWSGGKPESSVPAVQSIEVKTLVAPEPGR